MQRTMPRFRAEHVDSLLRPGVLREVRAKRERGEHSAAALTAIEDQEIKSSASIARGRNALAQDRQWAKLRVIIEIASDVWES